LTIAFIGFEVGLGLDIYEVLAQSRRAVLLSVLGFAFSTCVVGIFLHFTFNIGLDYAFLLASAWGGVSTMTVSVVCKHLNIGKEAFSTLTISSLVDDIVVLVVALTLLNYITLGGLGFEQVSLNLVRNLSVSVFVGVIVGVAWLYVLYFCRQAEFVYSLVLAALLGVYSGTEMLGGTGGIAIFIFGLILGNCRSLVNSLKLKVDSERLFDLKELVRKFHSELAFILTTFFFVFLGLIYMWTGWLELLLGLVISLLLHGSRLLAVRIGTLKSELTRDFPAIGLIVGKGAASAAMSTLPLAYGLPNAEMLTSIALNVILLTNVFSVILPIAFAKKSKI
jgi:cell volume regulation protein A